MGRLVTNAPAELRGRVIGAAFALLLISLAGARIFYQLNQPAAPLGLPLGGLSWGGAMLGGWLALPLVAALAGVPVRRLADLMVPISAAILTAAWLGCWMDGCAYGRVLDAGYGVAARDDWGNFAVRYPLQLLGAVLALATLAAADLLHTRIKIPGLAAGPWLAATGFQLWWLQSLRVDPVPTLNAVPLNLWAAGTTALLGLILILLSLSNRSQPPSKHGVEPNPS